MFYNRYRLFFLFFVPFGKQLISRKQNDDNDNSLLYEIKFINNERRHGMFATKDIVPGTIILEEKAIMSLPKKEYRNNKSCEDYINEQFKLLSGDDQKKVLKLHDNLNDNKDNDENKENKENDNNDPIGCYRTNAYMFTDNVQYESGLFLNISRINHSCFPNAQFIDDSKHGINSIVSLFGIKKGDEITHCYFDLDLFMMSYEKRQKYIKENYGFICKCSDCQLFKQRDQFRKKYKKLEEEMEKEGYEQMNSEKILECSSKMINVIKNHFNSYPPLLSQCYMKFAEASLHLAHYDDVVKYMKMSAMIDLKFEGEGCDLNDILQCKIMLPIKYQNAFCWDHICGNVKYPQR